MIQDEAQEEKSGEEIALENVLEWWKSNPETYSPSFLERRERGERLDWKMDEKWSDRRGRIRMGNSRGCSKKEKNSKNLC